MRNPRVLLVRGNGINADAELAEAFRLAGGRPEVSHVGDLVAEPSILDGFSILAFPGGFSYGDHLGSGQVLALLCRRHLAPALEAFVKRGGLCLGVCNGFQALVKMGMLPNRLGGAGSWERVVSLVHNASGSFVDAWVPLRFEAGSSCVWTAGGLPALPPRLLPIRHGEGRFVTRDPSVLAGLEKGGLVALRYGEPGSEAGAGNPNGSEADIAGICDPTGRVFGIMPHPEAFLVAENGPRRRRGGSGPTGLDLFERGIAAALGAS
jgi:phosphoribosylformylglycinamidine synthase